MTTLTIILLVFILILALFLLGWFVMRKIGARGCAACDNQSCPLRTAPKVEKKMRSDFKADTLSGDEKDPRKKIL